ncbi:MAG: hypothetical protein KDJ74_00535 [Notoacmeibacter sp.]|nr:hypothetical protein [Notoacmeibacter sp.]
MKAQKLPRAAWFISLALACVPASAHAADIETVTGKPGSVDACSYRVSGRIASGDADKVEQMLATETGKIFNYPDTELNQQITVCLSGPGGNYLEGIRLALVYSRFDVTTVIADGDTCLSACAVSFLGGRYNSRSGVGYSPSRYLFPNSVLGFHAPQLVVAGGDFTSEQVLNSWSIALDAIAEIQKHKRDLFIDDDLIAELVAHRGDDFYYVSTVDDLGYFNIELAGARAETIREDTIKAACWNAYHWLYFDTNKRFSDAEWNEVFAGNYGQFDRRTGIYEMGISDGSMSCLASEPDDAPEIYPIRVILSWGLIEKPDARYAFNRRILFRGNRQLPSTR